MHVDILFPAPFVEKVILSPSNGLGTLVENQLAIRVWFYCRIFNSIPLAYISMTMPAPQYFDSCRFVVKL